MYASLLLSSFLTLAAPVPEFKLTPEEQEAIKALEPFGFKAVEDRTNKLPYGTVIGYGLDLGYDRVQGKSIHAPVPTQKDLAPLAKLRRTRRLFIPSVPGGDATLDLLRGMDRLEYLDIRGLNPSLPKVTDEGVKKLIGLKRLKWLYLDQNPVTDAGLKALADHPALTSLSLEGTQVTEKGLKHLQGNERLTELLLGAVTPNFREKKNKLITDACLPSLGKMPNLSRLSVHGTAVTDKGLATIAEAGNFPKLTILLLHETEVSDTGLKALHDAKALPALKRIQLAKTKVTSEGIKALKAAHPQWEILR